MTDQLTDAERGEAKRLCEQPITGFIDEILAVDLFPKAIARLDAQDDWIRRARPLLARLRDLNDAKESTLLDEREAGLLAALAGEVGK